MNDFYDSGLGGQDPVIQKKETKKVFSIIGFGAAAVIAVQILFGVLAGLLIKNAVLPEDFFDLGGWNYYLYAVAVYVVSFSAGIAILYRTCSKREKNACVNERPGAGFVILSLAVVFTMVYFGSVISNVINVLFSAVGNLESSQSIPELTGAADTVGFFVLTVVIAPFIEEFFYRKLITGTLARWGWRTALLLGSLLFASSHGNIEQFCYTFTVGLVFGYVYLYTGRLGYSVLLHALLNFIGGFLTNLVNSFLADPAVSQGMQDIYDKISSYSLGAEALRSLGELLPSALPAIIAGAVIQSLSLGLTLSGAVTLLFFRKRIRLLPGPSKLEKKEIGDTVFLSPGIAVFFLLAVVALALSFAQTAG